jgi:hypothetical protein
MTRTASSQRYTANRDVLADVSTRDDDDKEFFTQPRSGFCQRLPRGATASMLWNENAERIINISRANIAGPLVNVTDETYPSWLKGLFSLMHTRFLRLGYKHPPLPPDMQRVLKLVDTAMQKVERIKTA